jgi:hypothetical protein
MDFESSEKPAITKEERASEEGEKGLGRRDGTQ